MNVILQIKLHLLWMMALSPTESNSNELQFNVWAILTLLSWAVIIIVVIYIVLFKRRNSKQITHTIEIEPRTEDKDVEIERLRAEIIHRSKDLERLSLDISRRQQWTKKIFEKSRSLKSKGSQACTDFVEELLVELRNELILDQGRMLTLQSADKLSQDFSYRLRERYPDLSESEYALCALIKMNLSSKEIAAVKNIAPKSAVMARYRLKQKLNITDNRELVDILNEI